VLLLRGNLLIGFAPRTDLQATAYPAEVFLTGVGAGERSTGTAAHGATLGSRGALSVYRALGHLKNLR